MRLLAITLLVVVAAVIESAAGRPQDGMRYVGCFVDSRSRDLPVFVGRRSMTPRKCYRLCKDRKYGFFGVQYAKECRCGNAYGGFGKRPNSECNMRCTGDKSKFCGAGWRNSIYSTGVRRRTPQGATKMRYIGCFVDSRSRDLPVLAGTFAMSPKKCFVLCRGRNYSFFGVQYGKECRCGNVYGGFGRRPNKECKMPCTGDKSKFCGAGWRNNVYATGVRHRTPQGATHLKYIGCFVDSRSRDLPVLAGTFAISPKKCFVLCRGRNFGFFGLQYGRECRCGNVYGGFGRRPNKECNMPCQGDKTKLCGAGWRNSVYATGVRRRRHPGALKLTFRGCFVDRRRRDLPVLAGTFAMSPKKCFVLCSGRNFAYFGLQYGKECRCGNRYGRYGQRPSKECNMRCTGDKSKSCGAGWRNNIYSTGLERWRAP